MAENVDELTVNYSESGKLLVKELDKAVLSKGAWSTVVFKYRDWDEKAGDFGPIRFTIRRYQKRGGQYITKSKFNISSVDQAEKLIGVLKNWLVEEK